MKTDFLILGGGLSGLLTAAYLEKAGKNYLILEALDECGGYIRGQEEQGVWLDYGLKSIPVSDVSTNPLLKLKEDLGLNFNIETLLAEPQYYQHKTGFIPFVGFGENKNRALVAELSYYTTAPRLLVSNGWKTLSDELLKIIPEKKIKTKSHVTAFEFEGDDLKSVTVNGEQKFEAQTYIYALPLSAAAGLFPAGKLNPKFLQKLDKNTKFTAVSLDLATPKRIDEKPNIMVFNDDEFYMLGQFVTNCDPLKQAQGLQISTWMTLLESEDAQNEEVVAKALKTMKKTIKKAFPTLIDEASWERILVAKDTHYSSLEVPDTSAQLWFLGSHTQMGAKNLFAAIQSVQNFAQKSL